jgi:hypothetical protein
MEVYLDSDIITQALAEFTLVQGLSVHPSNAHMLSLTAVG